VVGAYPNVIRLRERMRRYIGIWPAATLAGFWVWGRWPRFDLVLRMEGRELRRRTVMVWIGTGPSSFPSPHAAPVAGSGDGLEVVILPSARRRHGARLFRALWAARHGEGPETVGLEVLHAPAVEIDSRHHIQLTLDAEPLVLSAPVRIRLERDALRVVCGPTGS
jgi:diacylglycerol kinase family enzyme